MGRYWGGLKPYYQDDLVTIYHDDAREYEPDDSQVLVTDPPYGVRGALPNLSELLRVNGAVFGYPEALIGLCRQLERTPDDWIVWWPTNAGLRSWAPPNQTPRESEHVAIFGQVRWVYGAPASPNADKLVSHGYLGMLSRGDSPRNRLGRRYADVWTDASPGLGFQSHQRLHPNEKPVSVMRRVLQVVADGPVLDPFMGSGSTLVAAKSLNRPAIGIEIEERYCEIAARRCSQEVLGLSA